MAMGPMGGRGMRPAEKSKRGLRGVQRELLSYSEKIRLPMLIALVLAAAGAVLTILGPNQLSKITNLISDSLQGRSTSRPLAAWRACCSASMRSVPC